MLDPLTIHQPRTVEEASSLLARLGDEAAFYAGGTELLVVMKERLASISHLVDIKRIPGLREIAIDGARPELQIGALATHYDLEHAPLVRQTIPALAGLESAVANVRVRTAGTIGGNLCFADPHSDPATLLVALGARLTLASAADAREVSAEDFVTGLLETVRRHDELLTQITVPVPDPNVGVAYERFKLHERPTAAVAAVVAVRDGLISSARLVSGCVGERPQRLPRTEGALIGQPATTATAKAASATIRDEVETASDPFESAAYKRQLAATVGGRAIAAALRRASNGDTEGRRHVDVA